MAEFKEQIAALASMTPAQLRAEWRRTFRRETPPHSPDLLARAIAWKLQAKVQGELAPGTCKTLEQLVEKMERDPNTIIALSARPTPGTRLVRDWNGRTIHVVVTDDGFLFEDRHYHSLTQIARAVTGAGWSGPRFFGLVRRSSPSARAGAADGQAT